MPEILELIKNKDRLAYSQNYSVKRPYKGNTTFPDVRNSSSRRRLTSLRRRRCMKRTEWTRRG